MDWAFAMTPGAGLGGGSGGNLVQALVPLALMFLVFYFLLIRPQQKRSRQQKEFLEGLKRGDEVVTTGGIHGKITGLTDSVVTMEIADKVRIKVQRSQVANLKPKSALEKSE
jgi:preprotein translocase subunit YajC